MNIGTEQLSQALAVLAARPGIRGCALVDAATGMIWMAHGELAARPSLWEAAADHWRLHERHGTHFECLGRFAAVATYHAEGVMAVFRCATDPELLFIAVGRHRVVDWPTLQRMGLRVGEMVAGRA